MATWIYIAIFLILQPSFSFAINDAKPSKIIPQIRPQKEKKTKGKLAEDLIQWVKPLKWADLDFSGKKKDGSGSESGDGSENGDGSGTGDGLDGAGGIFGKGASGIGNKLKANGTIGMDENTKGNPEADPGPKSGNGLPPGNIPPGGPKAPPLHIWPNWWPVCVLVGPGIDANQQIKTLMEMSDACKVNLEIYSATIDTPDWNDPGSINKLQASTCNLESAGVAPRGSTLVITDQSSTVADKMCGIEKDRKDPKRIRPSTDVAGCNEVAGGGGGENTNDDFFKRNGQDGDGYGGIASGGVAVGIVDAEGVGSGQVWSHETVGHGELGWGNGRGAGNGIANPNDPDDRGEGPLGQYTDVGCAQMRARALTNDGTHVFDPEQQIYYAEQEVPLQLGEPYFGLGGPPTKPIDMPPPQNPPQLAGTQLPAGDRPRGTDAEAKTDVVQFAAGASGGHKKPILTGRKSTPNKIPDATTALASTAVPAVEQAPPSTPISVPVPAPVTQTDNTFFDNSRAPDISAETGKATPTSTLRMDETRGYADSAASALGNPTDNTPDLSGFSGGGGGSANIRMNENASAGGGSVSAGRRDRLSGDYGSADGSEESDDGLDKNFFKDKKKKRPVAKRGESLRRGGEALRSPASRTPAKMYQDPVQ